MRPLTYLSPWKYFDKLYFTEELVGMVHGVLQAKELSVAKCIISTLSSVIKTMKWYSDCILHLTQLYRNP